MQSHREFFPNERSERLSFFIRDARSSGLIVIIVGLYIKMDTSGNA